MKIEVTPDLIQAVRNFARKMTKQWENDDLVQQTFLKALDNQEKFDGKNLKGWLYMILKNEIINQYRHNQKYQYENLREFHLLNPIQPDARLLTEEINREIENLPRRLRIPFVEFIILGYHYEEIAERNSMKLGSVKSNIYQARETLKTHIPKPQNY